MKRLCAVTLICSALLLYGTVCAATESVLIIQSYSEDLAWTRQCNRGIVEAIGSESQLVFFYLDTKRIPQSEFQRRADEALALFAEMNPAVVLLGDDNALALLGPAIAESGVPIVYFGINNNPRNYFFQLPDNVVGVIERIPLFPWVRMIVEIMPESTNALVLLDGSPTAEAIVNTSFRKNKHVFLDGCDVVYVSTNDWLDWQGTVTAAGEYDFIVMPVYHALKDESGNHIPYEKVVTWISANSPVPVFSTQEYAVGENGVVGAYAVHGLEHGRIAGRIASTILSGRSPKELPALDDQQGLLFFNKRQLQRFGLDLPSTIREKAFFR